MKQGLFIAFEGIDGSGKSTQIDLLGKYLKKMGRDVFVTCEPSDFRVGKMIREYLRGEIKGDNRVIAALFVADRLEHILDENNGMLKKRNEGAVVLTDRYYFSSYAYQSVDMPMEWIINANSEAAKLMRPDVTIFLDISPEAAMDRIRNGREETELFENKERLRATRMKYFEAFERMKDSERVEIVDAQRSVEEIHNDIKNIVKSILNK